MTTPRLPFALALVPLALIVPWAACSSSSPDPMKVDPAHADVVFEGTATDTALTAMLAAKAVDDPAHAVFDNPKDLSELPGDPVLTFTWHDGQATAFAPGPPPSKGFDLLSPWGEAPHSPRSGLPRPSPPRERALVGVLANLLGERTAYAGTAMSGRGYLLAFASLDTGEPYFRVFTSGTSYTPDQAHWAKLATGTWTTLHVVSATFAGDQLAGGAAPVNGQAIKFCIGMWK